MRLFGLNKNSSSNFTSIDPVKIILGTAFYFIKGNIILTSITLYVLYSLKDYIVTLDGLKFSEYLIKNFQQSEEFRNKTINCIISNKSILKNSMQPCLQNENEVQDILQQTKVITVPNSTLKTPS